MKTVYTFVVVTFIMSLFLWAIGAIEDNSLSVIGNVLDIVNNGVSGSNLWYLIFGGSAGFVILMGGVAAATAIFGADASIARVAAYTAFATRYCLGLIGDYYTLLDNARTGCEITVSGLCTISYYLIWFFVIAMIVGFIFALLDLIGGND